jgi:hypothetical protein
LLYILHSNFSLHALCITESLTGSCTKSFFMVPYSALHARYQVSKLLRVLATVLFIAKSRKSICLWVVSTEFFNTILWGSLENWNSTTRNTFPSITCVPFPVFFAIPINASKSVCVHGIKFRRSYWGYLQKMLILTVVNFSLDSSRSIV